MELKVKDETIDVSWHGGTIIIDTSKGTYTDEVWKEEPHDFELPIMLNDAFCIIDNGQSAPTFEEWEKLWGSGNEKQDRADYEREHKAAKEWSKVSNIKAADILKSIKETYGEL